VKLRNRTDNAGVEDRRGQGGGGLGGLGGMLGGGGGIPMGRAGGGGLVLLALVFFVGRCALGGGGGGFDLDGALNGLGGETSSGGSVATAPANESDSAELTFVKQVRSNVQDYWAAEFDAAGETYEPAGLVLFDSPTSTGCGVGSPETGPFYCPADKKVYFDLGFYRQMAQQFGIRGDTALAYVIAHEMGHHVQNLLGIDDQVRRQMDQSPDQQNELSVRQELQAPSKHILLTAGARQVFCLFQVVNGVIQLATHHVNVSKVQVREGEEPCISGLFGHMQCGVPDSARLGKAIKPLVDMAQLAQRAALGVAVAARARRLEHLRECSLGVLFLVQDHGGLPHPLVERKEHI